MPADQASPTATGQVVPVVSVTMTDQDPVPEATNSRTEPLAVRPTPIATSPYLVDRVFRIALRLAHCGG